MKTKPQMNPEMTFARFDDQSIEPHTIPCGWDMDAILSDGKQKCSDAAPTFEVTGETDACA